MKSVRIAGRWCGIGSVLFFIAVSGMVMTAVAQPADQVVVMASLPAGVDSPVDSRAGELHLMRLEPGTDLSLLIGRPRVIGYDYYYYRDPVSGEKRLGGFVEVCVVVDTGLEHLLATSLDFDSYSSFLPRILYSKVEWSGAGRYHVTYHSGIRILGVEVSYKGIEESILNHFPDGSVGINSRLLKSEEGELYEHYTSIYYRPVVVDGRPMTFVRYFNRPGVRNPTPGMLTLLDIFGPLEGRAQLQAIVGEARKRAGGK